MKKNREVCSTSLIIGFGFGYIGSQHCPPCQMDNACAGDNPQAFASPSAIRRTVLPAYLIRESNQVT